LALNIGETEFQLALERSFGRRLNMQMIMVCAYSSREVAEEREGRLFINLLKAHGHAIFPGIALKLE